MEQLLQTKQLTPLEALRYLKYGFTEEVDISIIEKSLKALEIIKELFDFDFALRFPSNQHMLRITNKRTNEYWEISIPKEKYDLFQEVLL